MGDYIKREDAYRIALRYGGSIAGNKICQLPAVDIASQETMRAVDDAFKVASVQLARMSKENAELKAQMPKRGEWTEENRRPRSSQFVCSVCHRTAYDPQPSRDPKWVKRCRYAYCPNCGAKMEVQE